MTLTEFTNAVGDLNRQWRAGALARPDWEARVADLIGRVQRQQPQLCADHLQKFALIVGLGAH